MPLRFNERTIFHKVANFSKINIFEIGTFLPKRVKFYETIVMSVFMTYMICRAKFKS